MKIEFDPGEQMRLVTALICLERYKNDSLDLATSEQIAVFLDITYEMIESFFSTAEHDEITRITNSLSRFPELVSKFTN